MIYKKSIVLTAVKGGKEKGVLSLEYDGGEMIGNVRLYNFDKDPDGILSVGILHNGQVYKAGLTQENVGFYTFKLNSAQEMNSFSCALVNFVNGEPIALLHGATDGVIRSEQRLLNSLSIFDENPNINTIEQTLNQNGIVFEDQDEIEKFIDSEVSTCTNNCSECKYRDAFFRMEDKISLDEEQEDEEESFFDGVKEQIQTLFDKFPEEDILKQIIPESKWAKIDIEETGEYYVVGLMYENDSVKYVCYGIPSIYGGEPPKELKGFAQWLPIDSTKVDGFGYWITYQDAETGENVKLEFENV